MVHCVRWATQGSGRPGLGLSPSWMSSLHHTCLPVLRNFRGLGIMGKFCPEPSFSFQPLRPPELFRLISNSSLAIPPTNSHPLIRIPFPTHLYFHSLKATQGACLPEMSWSPKETETETWVSLDPRQASPPKSGRERPLHSLSHQHLLSSCSFDA